jgi:hypothetical protein
MPTRRYPAARRSIGRAFAGVIIGDSTNQCAYGLTFDRAVDSSTLSGILGLLNLLLSLLLSGK